MKRNIIIITATLLLTLTGCSGFLTEDNKSNATAVAYYATPDGYEALVNSCYSSLRDVFSGTTVSPTTNAGTLNGMVEIFCGGTDLFQKYLASTTPASSNQGLETYQNLAPSDVVVTLFYTNVYTAIKRCNDAIHYGETQNPVRLAEVRFLRAFYYFQLVQQFGDVALVTDFLTSPIKSYERTPAKDVYSFIINEMEAVLQALPATSDPGRVNQRVVNHFLALVYLTRGYDANLGGSPADFTKAVTYATAAINNQALNLDFEKDVFWPGKDNNAEIIFAVQYSAATLASTSAGNAWGGYFGPYLGGSDASMGDGMPYVNSIFRPTARLYQLMMQDPNDTRFEKTFLQILYGTAIMKLSYYSYFASSPQIRTIQFYYPKPGTTDADIAAWRAVDPTNRTATIVIPADSGDGSYSTWLMPDNSRPVYPSFKKFASPATVFSTTSCNRNIFLARLAETYLIRAEAEINASNAAAAATDINVVRTRSGATNIGSSQATIDFLLDERARELAGEYQRWYDLKRTGKLTTYVPLYNPDVTAAFMQGTGGQYKILRPIPQSAVNLNGAAITQNPGY